MADAPASSAAAPSAASGSAWSGAKLAAGALALCVAGAVGWHAVRNARAPRPAPSAVAAAPAAPAATAAPIAGGARPPDPSLAAAAAARAATPAAEPQQPRMRRHRAPARPNLDAEVQLIAAADALVRSERYAAAMQTLAAHERRFPRGELRQERSALRVLSMCGHGPSAPALRAREHFLTTAKDSVLTARVRSACSADGALDP
jgi:TolA-binding protein